jgi:hypothetical protein
MQYPHRQSQRLKLQKGPHRAAAAWLSRQPAAPLHCPAALPQPLACPQLPPGAINNSSVVALKRDCTWHFTNVFAALLLYFVWQQQWQQQHANIPGGSNIVDPAASSTFAQPCSDPPSHLRDWLLSPAQDSNAAKLCGVGGATRNTFTPCSSSSSSSSNHTLLQRTSN